MRIKNLLPIPLSMCAYLLLIVDGNTAMEGAKSGIRLCAYTVIPSMLPFIFLSNYASRNMCGKTGRFFSQAERIIGLPPKSGFLLIPAFLSGYPVGAGVVGNVYKEGAVSRENAQVLLAFSNNAGPAFIFGFLGNIFHARWILFLLWIEQVFCAVLILQRFKPNQEAFKFNADANAQSDIASKTIQAVEKICIWIILFSVISAFIRKTPLAQFSPTVKTIILGCIELTNGCFSLPNIQNQKLRIILCSGLITFGGLCVSMQTQAVANGIPMKKYYLIKTLESILAMGITSVVLFCPWLLPIIILPAGLMLYQKKNKGGFSVAANV